MILVSSNLTKIAEFKNYLGDTLQIQSGKDLPEVLGTIDEVITYKSLDAGDGYIVEDTILIINGEEVVDIRWKIDSLQEGDEATWITSLGYNKNGVITVYRGYQKGVLTKSHGTDGFAFDPYFIPIELIGSSNELTLTELGENKSKYSSRVFALQNLSHNFESFKIEIKDIPIWTGNYQH
jgi:inosine/xanthosine triphosphate pyrophosphatase family protein